jgi:hypothetical protein
MTWKQLSTGIRYFLVGIIGLISATDVIPSTKIKLYTLVLSGAIILLKSIDIAKGISDESN